LVSGSLFVLSIARGILGQLDVIDDHFEAFLVAEIETAAAFRPPFLADDVAGRGDLGSGDLRDLCGTLGQTGSFKLT